MKPEFKGKMVSFDWLVHRDNVKPTVQDFKEGLKTWAGGLAAGQRKVQLFEDRIVSIALEALANSTLKPAVSAGH